MYPAQPSPDTPSDAERRIFGRLRDELPDDWVVLHSLGLASHRKKPWAEIDFVVIGPPGIACLEVKGGRVERERGKWVFINRHGHRNVKPEGPYEQVGGASSALYAWLKETATWTRNVVVGYGVVVPDTEFTVAGPDILPEVLYDSRHAEAKRTMGEYLDDVFGHWRERLDARRATEPLILDRARIDDVRELLRADFDLVPTPAVQARGANRELVRLTEEQSAVMRGLHKNARLWVTGGAGTGKTLLAMEEVRRLADQGNRVLYICFNKRLARVQAENVAGSKRVRCTHLHGLLTEIVREHLNAARPDVDDDHYFRMWLPEQAIGPILEADLTWDALVVDEGQDLLLEPYIDVLDALLIGGLKEGCWRWFSDPAQNLFEATSPAAVQRLEHGQPARFELTVNCRNTEPIATTAHLISGVPLVEVATALGPEVDTVWYRDQRHARREVSRKVARLISGGIKPGSIIVLGRRHLDASLLREGFESSVPYPLVESPDPDGAVEYATIGSYKGLEADAVVLVDVDGFTAREVLADLYAGATRARSHLVVAIAEDHREGYEAMAARFGQALVAGHE